MTLKVAITGNMGSGKTTVCKIFEQLKVPVFYADKVAKNLYSRPEIQEKIIHQLGEDCYHADGSLNTTFFSQLIFSDASVLRFVENLIHPKVANEYHHWHQEKHQFLFTLYEAAILFEKGNQQKFHKIIYVAAPQALRLKRIEARDGLDKKSILQRMDKQWPDEKKISLSDYVIHNDGLHMLIPQVLHIREKLKRV